jgi:hypothetical protein
MATFCNYQLTTHDDYMTPDHVWDSITHYIPKNIDIWEPFLGNGDSQRYLSKLGYNIICDGDNFFESKRFLENNIVVSNPPFTKYKEIIEILVKYKKPFMLILPISKLNTSCIRENLKNEIQLIIPRKRIQFNYLENGVINKTKTGRCSFDCGIFCYKIGLDRDIIFLDK